MFVATAASGTIYHTGAAPAALPHCSYQQFRRLCHQNGHKDLPLEFIETQLLWVGGWRGSNQALQAVFVIHHHQLTFGFRLVQFGTGDEG